MIARFGSTLAGLALVASAATLAAPASAKSKSVEDRLSESGFTYKVDEDGDYKLGISWSTEKRSQLVFVSGSTEEVAGLTIRTIFSPAAIVDTHGVNGKTALELLEASGQTKLGSWEIRGGVVYFVAKVLDSASAEELAAVINVVAESADDKEIELTGGKDDL